MTHFTSNSFAAVSVPVASSAAMRLGVDYPIAIRLILYRATSTCSTKWLAKTTAAAIVTSMLKTGAQVSGIPASFFNARLLSNRPDLGLHRLAGKCVDNPRIFRNISLELGLRGAKQECSHYPNEISAFRPELVLRDIPWKLVQRRWQFQRFRNPAVFIPLLDPLGSEIIGMLLTPFFLFLLSPCGLAVRFFAGSLSQSHSGIRTEPAAANATGFLSCVGHGDSSSPHLSMKQWPQKFLAIFSAPLRVSTTGAICSLLKGL